MEEPGVSKLISVQFELSRPPSRMYPRRFRDGLRVFSGRIGALVLPLAFVLAGCDLSLGHLRRRRYRRVDPHLSAEPRSEVRIVNTNGESRSEGVDGSTVGR